MDVQTARRIVDVVDRRGARAMTLHMGALLEDGQFPVRVVIFLSRIYASRRRDDCRRRIEKLGVDYLGAICYLDAVEGME